MQHILCVVIGKTAFANVAVERVMIEFADFIERWLRDSFVTAFQARNERPTGGRKGTVLWRGIYLARHANFINKLNGQSLMQPSSKKRDRCN
jgi:hypothetical protein